ncbi:hypothetical protein GQ44DRAFT_768200 [Phaeosphaeriaceae sp. PMI808]|nr:hypothetical protein GQ44DRAFT_768200 [Phaeosphaeriaceae sp. PMI808]
MSNLKNVIIVGAGGNLGPTVLNTFVNESSFNTTVLSREGSSSTFPPGTNVIHADYNSLESLKNAFKGQDVVISLVGGAASGDQNKLIDAAIAAGVQRFIPSEFGSKTDDSRNRVIAPFFEPKFATLNYLKSKEREITGFLGFDAITKTATIFDNGAATFSTTNLHTIGITLIKLLEKAELSKNQYVYVSSAQTSQKQLLEMAEKITGEKWTVNNVPAQQHIEEGRAKLQKGDFSGMVNLIQGAIFGAEEELGNLEPAGLWNERLGIPEDDLEKTVRVAFAGKLVHEA